MAAMKICLVTGAAGFIGSKVCELLIHRGDRVVGIDNLNDFYDVRLKDYRLARLLGETSLISDVKPTESKYAQAQELSAGRFTFKPVDIEDRASIDKLFEKTHFDVVFNLGARAGVRYSIENPHVYLTTNTHGTLNLLEAQRRFGVNKHVLASTSSLYAGCSMPYGESLPVNTPQSPYAASKKAAEVMAYTYHKLFGIDVSVLRYFTVFGPAGRPDMAPFRFIKWVQEGAPIRLFGDGDQSRDFTYLDDIAEGTVLAEKMLGYEIINLGGGNNPVSMREIISLIERLVGKRAAIESNPANAVDMRQTWADINKAAAMLNWAPKVSVNEGFRRTVQWHNDNEELVRKITV